MIDFDKIKRETEESYKDLNKAELQKVYERLDKEQRAVWDKYYKEQNSEKKEHYGKLWEELDVKLFAVYKLQREY